MLSIMNPLMLSIISRPMMNPMFSRNPHKSLSTNIMYLQIMLILFLFPLLQLRNHIIFLLNLILLQILISTHNPPINNALQMLLSTILLIQKLHKTIPKLLTLQLLILRKILNLQIAMTDLQIPIQILLNNTFLLLSEPLISQKFLKIKLPFQKPSHKNLQLYTQRIAPTTFLQQ